MSMIQGEPQKVFDHNRCMFAWISFWLKEVYNDDRCSNTIVFKELLLKVETR